MKRLCIFFYDRLLNAARVARYDLRSPWWRSFMHVADSPSRISNYRNYFSLRLEAETRENYVARAMLYFFTLLNNVLAVSIYQYNHTPIRIE